MCSIEIINIINSMANCATWVIILRVTGSETCNYREVKPSAITSAITSLRDGHEWYYHPKLHSLAMLLIANSMVADRGRADVGWVVVLKCL